MHKGGEQVKLRNSNRLFRHSKKVFGRKKMQNQRMGSTMQFPSMQFRTLRFMVRLGSVCLVALALTCFGGKPLVAQGRFPRVNQLPTEGILMPMPREIQVLLDEAQANIDNAQWSEATLTLGMLLGLEDSKNDDLSGIDFFLVYPPATVDPLSSKETSVFRRAIAMIQSLPLEATKFIDLRYGVGASQSLEKAIEDSDWESVERVAGQFSFTTAGQDACVILGEHWLRKGDARRAARFLRMAFDQKSALTRLGPELGVFTAAAFQSAGAQSTAHNIIFYTRQQFAKVSLNWNGANLGWDDSSTNSKDARERIQDVYDSIQDVLKRIGSDGSHSIERIVKQPYYLGGNASRNADTSAGLPLPTLRWHTELHESKQHKENLERTLKEKHVDGKSMFIPSRNPISVGQWVITSTYDQRIVAIDSQTGKLGWECFFSGMPLGFSMDRFPSRDSHSLSLAAPDYLAKRVWGETVVGMPSSDGQHVFSISELPAIDIAESFALGQNARVTKPQGARNFNVMQCWSVQEEGKLKWEVGGQKSLTEPKLAGALFLGAPFPHDNELLVLGELNSDVYLFALAPKTGKLRWRQPLVTNSSSIAADQMRRSIGVVPAADGSIIVCPTLSGFVVGFDAVSHALLWSFQYPVKITPGSSSQFNQFGQVEVGDFSPLLGRSADVSVLIHDGVVLVAPPDGEGVYALSAETGKLLWQTGANLEQVRYVACAWNNMAFIVCQSSLVALDLNTGKDKWPAVSLPNGNQIVGRGARKGDNYYLPTSGQEIVQIRLETGEIVETVRMEQPLGNLVSVGDRLICASPFELDCYSVREAFQSQLKEELQKSSVSKSGLTRQAELALAKRDFDSALSFLDQAKAIDPNSAEVLMLMNKAGIAALTADFDKYVDRVSLAQDLAFDRERSPYLRLLTQGLMKQERFQDALLKLFELSDLRTSQRQEQMSNIDFVEQSPQLTVQEDRWIASQIRRCYEKLTPSQIGDLTPNIALRLNAIRGLPPNVRRFKLEHLDSIGAAESLRFDSARELIDQRDLLQAERMLMSGSFSDKSDKADPKSESSLRRRSLLAEIYARTGRFDVALAYLDGDLSKLNKMMEGMRDITSFSIPGGAALAPFVKQPQTKWDSAWPMGKIKVTATAQPDVPLLPNTPESTTPCRWKMRVGKALANWSVHFEQGNWTFSSPSNEEEFRLFIDPGSQEKATIPIVHSVDSIVFIEMNRQIFAVNTLLASNDDQDGLLWRESFEGAIPENERGRGRSMSTPINRWGLPSTKGSFRVVSVSRSGIIALHEDRLICFDLTKGTKIWTSTGFKNCQFVTQDDILYVHRNRSILHLDCRDGTLIKEIQTPDVEGNSVGSIGRFWLMESNVQKKYPLRLIDAVDGSTIFSKEFSADTRLSLDGESGVIALQASGDLTYWKLDEQKEFVTRVKVEGNFGSISAQRFGDTILVLPNASSQSLDNIEVGPDVSDPNFAPIAGRMIAISAKDASQVWNQNNLVRQFFFPIAQNRNVPIAVFVRRLTLSKIVGINVDLMSIAIVDIRDGRVLFSQDDFPAVRNRGFVQKIFPEENTISIDYLGMNIELVWSTKEAETLGSPAPIFDFGNVDYKQFKKTIEARVRQQQADALKPEAPSDSPNIK